MRSRASLPATSTTTTTSPRPLLERTDSDLTQLDLNPFLILRIGCQLKRLLQLCCTGSPVPFFRDHFAFARERGYILWIFCQNLLVVRPRFIVLVEFQIKVSAP